MDVRVGIAIFEGGIFSLPVYAGSAMNLHMLRVVACRCLLAVAVLGMASCTTVDPVTGQKVRNVYSLQQDVELGQSTLQANTEQMKKSNVPVNADPRRLAYIQGVMNRIAAVSDLPQLPYNVTHYQTNIVNAAAAPGGSMFVFEGLFDPRKGLVDPNNENELAAVMAHEIAHVNCRHVTERMTAVMPAALLSDILGAIAVNQGKENLAQALQVAFAVTAGLLIPKYSRVDEFEADRIGMFYMAKAGYDPRAAPAIWKRVVERSNNRDKASIFATHPSDYDRYRTLNKMLPYAMEEYRKATGRYPPGYQPPVDPASLPPFNWRVPPKK